MLSIVIPCLNEEGNLQQLLGQLRDQKNVDIEIIVADGGSTDGTLTQATDYGAQVIHSNRGRGCQQNAGAAAATGDYLLFLHADSQLEHDCQLMEALECIEQSGTGTAGHFPLKFESGDPEVRERLRLFEYKTGLNRDGTFSGDQGLLIRRSDFRLLGGFWEKYHFLEDKEFAGRFSDYGKFITLPSRLHTSARRFEHEGLEERLILNVLIMGMFHVSGDHFFTRASEIYRDSSSDGALNLAPFFKLTRESVFYQGMARGLIRCFLIGRYATRNLWQVGLSYSIRRNRAESWLDNYDRYLKPATDNPVGHVLGTLVVVIWFYAEYFRTQTRQRFV